MKIKYAILIYCVVALPAFSCDVPVFRYALERWAPDAYEISVLYNQELTDEQITLLEPLLEKEARKPGGYNYTVHFIDLRDNSDAPVTQFIEEKPASYPWLVLRYPPIASRPYVIWNSALTGASVQMLISSPLRKEISQKIVEGGSAVWIFLESGNKQRDDEAYTFVESEVARLQRELELPQLDENVERESIYLDESLKTQLGISFSLFRLSRENKEEQAIIAMMLGSEVDLPLYADQPMVFPIFGQGRLLYALIGEGINSETMQDAGQFLVGPCSCQIKDENPGVDMLMPIVWTDHIETEMVRDRPLPAPIPALGGINATGELVALQAFGHGDTFQTNPALINLGYAIAGFILVSMAATAVIFLRKLNYKS